MSFFNPGDLTGSPTSMMDIMVSSLLFAFFGVMIFIGAVRYEANYDKEAKWWKWCFAPLAVAILFGIQKIAYLQDYAYRVSVLSLKALYAHYLSLVIPVLCVAGILLYNFLKKRGEERRVY